MSKVKKPQKPDTKTIGVRVSRDELALMQAAADRDGRKLSNWIRTMVLRGLVAK